MGAEALIDRENIMMKAVQSLQKHKYDVYSYCNPDMNLCFELLARHPNGLFPKLLLKFCENIDRIHPFIIQELKIFSFILQALPILIGKRNRREELKDNVIYERDNLAAVNEYTFERILDQPKYTYAIAKRGGYFQEVDGQKLRELRVKKKLSQEQLGVLIGVSRKSIANYENEQLRASIQHLEKLEEILNESVSKSMDFFNFAHEKVNKAIEELELRIEMQKKFKKAVREFVKMVDEIVEETGFKTYWPRASPLDVLIYQENEETNGVEKVVFFGGAIYLGKDREFYRYEQEFLTQELPITKEKGIIYDDEFINKRMKEVYFNTPLPFLTPDDLKLLEDPDEFRRYILKKLYVL